MKRFLSKSFMACKKGFSFRFELVLFAAILFLSSGVNAATISSTASGGTRSWSDPLTWVGGVLPTSDDDVIISAGSSVIIRSPFFAASPAACKSLTVDGTLTMGGGTVTGPKVLDVLSFVSIGVNGVFTNDGAELHRLNIGGNFTNNGLFVSQLNNGTIQVTLNGTTDQTLDGTNSIFSFSGLFINKTSGKVISGGSVTSITASTMTLTAGEFISPINLSVAGALTLTAGTFTAGNTLDVAGNFINNGAVFQPATSTVNFNGTGLQIISGTGTTNFHNISTTGASNAELRITTTIAGNLTIADGTNFTIQSGITVTGTTTVGGGLSGKLTVLSTAGTKTFVGHFTISSGATWDNIAGDNAHFQSGLTNNGTLHPGDGVYYFEQNAQTASGAITLPRIRVETGATLTNNGKITSTVFLSGPGIFVQGDDAVLNIVGTSTITTLVALGNNNTVNFMGGAQTIKDITYVNLGLSGTGVKTFGPSTTSISGNLSVSGAATSTTVVDMTIGGNLSIVDTGSLTVTKGFTVNGITTVGNGQACKLTMTSTSGTKTFVGNLTIASGATWDNANGDNAHFQGGLTNNGTILGGNGVYYFETNSPQIFSGKLFVPREMRVETGVELTNNGEISVGVLIDGAGKLIQGPNSILNVGGTISSITLITTAANNTVNYNGTIQTIRSLNYVNLGLSGTSATHIKTLQAGTTSISGNLTLSGTTSTATVVNIAVGGNLTIEQNASLTNNNTLTIAGALSGAGKIVQTANALLNVNGSSTLALIDASASNSVVNYNASTPSIIPGSYFNLFINQPSGLASLAGDVTVFGTITLNTGNLDLSNGNLMLESTSVLSLASPSASQMIVTSGSGELRRRIAAIGSFTFPLGDLSGTAEYSPVTVNVSAASGFTSAYIGASVANSKYISNNSNADFLTRYWKISQSGVADALVDVSGTYLPADVTGAEINIVVGQLSGTFDQITNGWKKFSTISGNVLSVTGVNLVSGTPSVFTGISGVSPAVTITGGDGPAVCVGTGVSLTAVTTGETPFKYVWSPSAGLSATNVADPTATPNSTTTYNLTAYDGNGFSVSGSTVVSIKGVIVSVNNLEICEGSSGTLTATAADSYTYEWSPSTGLSSSTGSSVIANPETTTTYTVLGIDTNTSCAYTATALVTVNELPVINTNDAEICLGASATLTASGALNYTWTPSDGLSATAGGSVVASPTVTTTYTVTGIDSKLCANTATAIVTVKSLPIIIVNSPTICAGTSATLTAGGADTFTWTPATNLSATTGSSVTANPTVTTTYTVTGTATSTTCSNTATATVTVVPLPAKPVITATNLLTETPILTSSADAGNQWFKNAGILTGSNSKTLTVTSDGSYTVQVTANGCTGPASDPYVIVITGIEEISSFGPSRIYPNPASERMQIEWNEFFEDGAIDVRIYDQTGRAILTKAVAKSDNMIDISNFAKGGYIFIASQNMTRFVQRFIKD